MEKNKNNEMEKLLETINLISAGNTSEENKKKLIENLHSRVKNKIIYKTLNEDEIRVCFESIEDNIAYNKKMLNQHSEHNLALAKQKRYNDDVREKAFKSKQRLEY